MGVDFFFFFLGVSVFLPFYFGSKENNGGLFRVTTEKAHQFDVGFDALLEVVFGREVEWFGVKQKCIHHNSRHLDGLGKGHRGGLFSVAWVPVLPTRMAGSFSYLSLHMELCIPHLIGQFVVVQSGVVTRTRLFRLLLVQRILGSSVICRSRKQRKNGKGRNFWRVRGKEKMGIGKGRSRLCSTVFSEFLICKRALGKSTWCFVFYSH
ncbi:hypothetical protein F5Y08DRAFT_187325 [Xylaria arbuscula]|nr:hypothetical protein F5Y08DRAFT_187325 [Xylaria arbuscula]